MAVHEGEKFHNQEEAAILNYEAMLRQGTLRAASGLAEEAAADDEPSSVEEEVAAHADAATASAHTVQPI